MQLLSEWIGNIIILILVAVIMELLVPNTAFQKYVKMVIGLLLILLLLSPLLSVFSIDKEKIFSEITFEQKVSEDFFEKSMNKKKKEIQATQSAYIEEQMAVHMKRQVEEELMTQYDMKLEKISISFEPNKEHNYENIEAINAFIVNEEEERVKKVKRVEEIAIKQKRPGNDDEKPIEKEIKNFLAKHWGIDAEILTIDIDGREEM